MGYFLILLNNVGSRKPFVSWWAKHEKGWRNTGCGQSSRKHRPLGWVTNSVSNSVNQSLILLILLSYVITLFMLLWIWTSCVSLCFHLCPGILSLSCGKLSATATTSPAGSNLRCIWTLLGLGFAAYNFWVGTGQPVRSLRDEGKRRFLQALWTTSVLQG